jgi:16S rRNA (cytidine1402-2'-O)-methyltransferase
LRIIPAGYDAYALGSTALTARSGGEGSILIQQIGRQTFKRPGRQQSARPFLFKRRVVRLGTCPVRSGETGNTDTIKIIKLMNTETSNGIKKTGTLYVVATPIGNLEDITLRAIRIFKEAEYVLCEDTRVTGKLLKHYDISAKMKRYDAHSSSRLQEEVIADLKAGKQIALCSDAGTPGVSDPGVHIIDQLLALDDSLKVVAVPGASSVTAAFSIAGIAGNQFTFLGFIPQKKGRQTFFKDLATAVVPVIFFESTHRIMKTLESLALEVPSKHIAIAREITKMHEEIMRGSAQEVFEYFKKNTEHQRGEFVVIVY